MTNRLSGKVAIITGAGTGIGEAIAHKFCMEGASVVCNGLPGDPVKDVVKNLTTEGCFAVSHIGDVAIESSAKACVDLCLKTYGRIDILVNNAGVFLETGETQELTISTFDKTITANIRSVFLMTKFALPSLQKTRGNIISAGSESGLMGLAQNTIYGGTKGFIHAFMKGVAVEQAKYGIRANCVCPGAIDTAWTHKETGPMNRKMEKMIIAATPLARRGTPEEIANVYAFLASEEASYVTGALWSVDGGITTAKGNVGDEVPKKLRKQPLGELKGLRHSRDGLKNKEIRTH